MQVEGHVNFIADPAQSVIYKSWVFRLTSDLKKGSDQGNPSYPHPKATPHEKGVNKTLLNPRCW